jgi:hypothetical protein
MDVAAWGPLLPPRRRRRRALPDTPRSRLGRPILRAPTRVGETLAIPGNPNRTISADCPATWAILPPILPLWPHSPRTRSVSDRRV